MMSDIIIIVLLVAFVLSCFLAFVWLVPPYSSLIPKDRDEDSEYRPAELDKDETLAILSGKQELCGNHVNWLNEKEGLPMMTVGDGERAQAGTKMYQYHRVEKHARDMGWID